MALDLSDDEELGEFIYRTSQTAKLLREKKEKNDEDRSIENHSLPINTKEEVVKAGVKIEDDISTDDEQHSPECVVSSSAEYDPIKSEETDNEDLADEDTNTSNDQYYPPTGDSSSEEKETEQLQKSIQSLANNTTRPRASTVQESVDIQCISKKRKREKEESNGSVEKTARIECSIEGCNRKAADSGKCRKKHNGYNYCSQEGCTKAVQKGGVCRSHKEFAMEIVKKVDYVTCSVEGCTRKAAGNGRCRAEHNGYGLCSQDGCTKAAQKGGVCVKHGAKIFTSTRTCSQYGCTNKARGKEGVCVKHGAAVVQNRKTCKVEGSTKQVQEGGFCSRHGAKKYEYICKHEGCTNHAIKGGVCIKHGAVVKRKTCKHDGCTNIVVRGGVCIRHGAKVVKTKTCSHYGCTKLSRKGGVCYSHREFAICKKVR